MLRGDETPEQRFDRLFRATHADVLAYLTRRARTPEDAADALSETYAAAWRKLDKLPDGDRARLWLFGAARNELRRAVDRIRAEDSLASELAAQLRTSFEERTAAGESDTALRGAVLGLSRLDQEIITLTAWEELTPREIAHVLDLSANVVRVRLHRARATLRATLRDQPAEIRPPSSAARQAVR
jgi:RNA polymerase sigma factor (sigma-70 family)